MTSKCKECGLKIVAGFCLHCKRLQLQKEFELEINTHEQPDESEENNRPGQMSGIRISRVYRTSDSTGRSKTGRKEKFG